MSGTLYGLGVGPGDPELLTLKAHRILTAAKIIAYPAPDEGTSFARSIVEQYLGAGKSEIAIIIPMRVERFPAQEIYDAAAAEIARHLDMGSDVVVLCEGDPFFYGSFMYLHERLAGIYPCEIVPGVSSIMAAAAAWQHPLAARNDVLCVVPAPVSDAVLLEKLASSEAIAIIKLGRHFERVLGLIEQAGLMDCAGYVERVSLAQQKIMALKDVKQAIAPYFSMILIYKGGESLGGKHNNHGNWNHGKGDHSKGGDEKPHFQPSPARGNPSGETT